MNVRLKYDFPFTAGIYHNGNFYMNNYSLRLFMATVSEDTNDQTTAFERLKYFIYTCIESTIFIDVAETEQCDRYVQAGLKITTMPGAPVDQLIGIMLYHKLNAVMENRMIVFETELSSAVGEYMGYLHSEEETTVGYIQPEWWDAADLTHNEIATANSDNVVAIPQATAWGELDMAWTDDVVNDESGNVVVFADFKKSDETE